MNRTFHIASDTTTDSTNAALLCELSQHHVCLALADMADAHLLQVSYYELKNILEPDKLRQLLRAEGIDGKNVKRVVIGNAMKETVLMPAQHFSEDHARHFFNATFGNTADAVLYDEIAAENLILVHALPAELMDVLKSLSPAEVVHTLSCRIKTGDGSEDEDSISVHFSGNEVSVIAKREQQLKLAQTYLYTAPTDVLYYLLALCREYGFSQEGTTLVLSGFVSEDSAMYKELHQYFSNILFWSPEIKQTVQSEHPAHFFSSLHNLAACVS